MRGKILGAQIQLAGPTFPRGGGTTNPIILLYNYYICILLIKTNPMIYIYCTKHGGKGAVCVLTVRDNELNIGEWGHIIGACRGVGHTWEDSGNQPLNS